MIPTLPESLKRPRRSYGGGNVLHAAGDVVGVVMRKAFGKVLLALFRQVQIRFATPEQVGCDGDIALFRVTVGDAANARVDAKYFLDDDDDRRRHGICRTRDVAGELAVSGVDAKLLRHCGL